MQATSVKDTREMQHLIMMLLTDTCANTRVGYHNDARRDRERFNSYFNKISDDVRPVGLNWQTNYFNIINRSPDVIEKKVVPNCTYRDQTAEITFTESSGTFSYTH